MGPIGAARVGFVGNEYVLNPTLDEMVESQLDLVVAGTANAVLMVESEAKELSEDVMLGAVMFGHRELQAAIRAINELTTEVGVKSWTWKAPERNEALAAAVKGAVGDSLIQAYGVRDKL